MGKKTKIGKSRKDKFYKLAKEIGYRSRASFKLLQLNRKFEFLSKSKVCVDLCAAPGGWLQVASQNMPVSSLIVGVDLVTIKPIAHCITLQEDITTDKCRQALKKELQTWKADVFLNDGAPNVGKNWLHDSFSQAQLTLHAMKLASEFLRKGGWFITKVFRSKDYQALIWVFKQLFNKVHATKPQASRNESAEIFVVCQGYKAPDSLDPKFTDPKHIFKDVETENRNPLNLMHPAKQYRHRDGYADGDYTLHHTLNASAFINGDNHLELLANCNEIVIDEPVVARLKATTSEIKECLRDIKVLGKKEIRTLLSWRQKVRKYNESREPKAETTSVEKDESDEEDEEERTDKEILELKASEQKELKKKQKKVRREKAKLRQKMDMKMILPGDRIETGDDCNLFDIKNMKTKRHLHDVEESNMEIAVEEEVSSDEELYQRKRTTTYDRLSQNEGDLDEYEVDSSDEEQEDFDIELEDDIEDETLEEETIPAEEENPLVVSINDADPGGIRRTDLWFSRDIFKDIESVEDEDQDVEAMIESHKKRGGIVIGEDKHEEVEMVRTKRLRQEMKPKTKKIGNINGIDKFNDLNDGLDKLSACQDDTDSDDTSDSGNESGSDDDVDVTLGEITGNNAMKTNGKKTKGGFEVVPVDQPAAKIRKLDATGLALGAAMIESKKRRREIIEGAYNKYTFNDDGPDWFSKEEKKYNKPQLPVTKAEVDAYKERLKAINTRPLKKVAEAKARKKRKAVKRLEKARKKANAVSDNIDSSEKEKWGQIKNIYKKAGLLNKKKTNVTYVVAKKGAGRKVSRPAGVKGRFKVVDTRMKKDNRKQKNNSKNKNKRGRK